MDISPFVIYTAFKAYPNNSEKTQGISYIACYEGEHVDFIKEIHDGGILWIQPSSNGWDLLIANSSDHEVAYYIDINTKSIDMTKSWRVKANHPECWYDGWLLQQISENAASWNSTGLAHRVLFDVIQPNLVQKINESGFCSLWTPSEELSTPWFKHEVVCIVNSGDALHFSISFFKASDINMDGKTDSSDLSLVLSRWDTPLGDVNGDGKTDAHDSGLVLAEWRAESSSQ